MSEPLTILVASKAGRTPQGLEHLGDYRLIVNDAAGWGAASNALLKEAASLGGDALFCDDDVTFTADSLAGVLSHADKADIFGLDLHTLDHIRQAGARHTWDGTEIHDWVQSGPAYVAHVTASALYLTAASLKAGVQFPIWPGLHWEDVAFCFSAWATGLKVAAVPGLTYHATLGGIGATKRYDEAFWEKWHANRSRFYAWCKKRDLKAVPREATPL